MTLIGLFFLTPIIFGCFLIVCVIICGDTCGKIKKTDWFWMIPVAIVFSIGIDCFAVAYYDAKHQRTVEKYVQTVENYRLLEENGFIHDKESFWEIKELNNEFIEGRETFINEIHFIENPYLGIEMKELPRIGR